MTPADLRNASYHSLRRALDGQRRAVYDAWVIHGPATTRQLADRCGIDLLSVRPRTTELFQLGLLALVPDRNGANAHEGIYRAATHEEFDDVHASVASGQQLLL